METRKHLAAEKKRCNSHNCAQAVICTYCDLFGIPEETALHLAAAYGTGMGNMEGTCGALVGAGMVIGLATKDRTLARSRMKQVMTKFQERNGATQCRMLKGFGGGVDSGGSGNVGGSGGVVGSGGSGNSGTVASGSRPAPVKPLRDCPDCVADACEFLEEYL